MQETTQNQSSHPFSSPTPILSLSPSSLSKLPNVQFYRNSLPATSRLLTISQFHSQSLSTNYRYLQQAHDYIQWLFPNFYKSQFNSSSYALTKLQAQYFRKSPEIGKRLLRSFQVYCDFIGVYFDTRNMTYYIVSAERAIDAIKINRHNHLRIKRILSCLSVTGLRVVALKFLEVLEMLVLTVKQLKYDEDVRRVFEREWKVYEDARIGMVDRIEEEVMMECNPEVVDWVRRDEQMREKEGKGIKNVKENGAKDNEKGKKRQSEKVEKRQKKCLQIIQKQPQTQQKSQSTIMNQEKALPICTNSESQQHSHPPIHSVPVNQEEQDSNSEIEVGKKNKEEEEKKQEEGQQIQIDGKQQDSKVESTPPVTTPPAGQTQSHQQQPSNSVLIPPQLQQHTQKSVQPILLQQPQKAYALNVAQKGIKGTNTKYNKNLIEIPKPNVRKQTSLSVGNPKLDDRKKEDNALIKNKRKVQSVNKKVFKKS